LRLARGIILAVNKIYVIVFAIILLLSCFGCGETPYIYEDGAILCGGDGKPIELINNSNATNPTYAQLVAFITKDSTDKERYTATFSCGDFAEAVHNNAEEAGIRAAFVSIDFEASGKGHALNAFQTIDRGLVYVDCTGEDLNTLLVRLLTGKEGGEDVRQDSNLNSWDKIAYIEIGKEYGALSIAQADSLAYSLYQEYKHKWETYHERLEVYNMRVWQHNKDVEQYNRDVEQYNRDVEQYNRDVGGKTYEELSKEEMGLRFQESLLNTWAAKMLDTEAEYLQTLGEELGDYCFEPLGIVEDINIHW